MPQESTQERLARIETLVSRGLKPSAAQLSRLILEKEPRNFEALIWLARTTTQPDEAEKAIGQAAQIKPDDSAVRELQSARQPASNNGNPFASSFASSFGSDFSAPPSYPSPTPPQPYAQPGFNYAPTPGYAPPVGSAPPIPTYGAPPAAPGYNAPATPSSYDYLRNLSSSPPIPGAPPATDAIKPVKKKSNPPGLIFGLLFLLSGLALAVIWTIMAQSFNSDVSQTPSPVQGQIVKLSESSLTADVQGQSRTFEVNSPFYKTLVPLVSDAKNNKSLSPNSVTLNVTPGGRLLSIDVVTPNRGSALNVNSNTGLLGLGPATDWALTGLGVVLALLGLLLLGRAVSKPKV